MTSRIECLNFTFPLILIWIRNVFRLLELWLQTKQKLQASYALRSWFILLPRGIVIDSIGFGRLLELAVVALNLPSHNTKNFIAMVPDLVTSKCNCLFL